jgi:hypothetical protein
MNTSMGFKLVWTHVKRFALAAISAALVYEGIQQIIIGVKYPVAYAIMHGINLVIKKGFREHVLLATPPYSTLGLYPTRAMPIAFGVILIVIGVFVSLLADYRSHRTAA